MGDAGPSEPGDALYRGAALDEVDRDSVALARDGEGRCLPGLLDELLEMRAHDLAKVEAGQDDVPELE